MAMMAKQVICRKDIQHITYDLDKCLKPGAAFSVTAYHFFIFTKEINIAGNKTRLVKVAVTNVREVSQPRALVPSNPLKQKIMKPAISTSDV